MIYKIYSDRIILADDAQMALAEVDFPMLPDHADTVEITHTFVDDTLRGQGIAGTLMQKLVEQLRKDNKKAVPVCSYAVGWFSKHEEAADVLAPAEQAAAAADTADTAADSKKKLSPEA